MARKCARQHQHRALRSMEVGNQGIRRGELIGREDELARPPVGRLHAIICDGGTFHRANHRRAYSHYALLIRLGVVDLIRRIVIQPELLGFHLVFR